ncbi:hypothetical protein GQ600_5668 [Phytophthora cactorum]|nr:hypothetical protein GQ600_5668 [Phytophthora cactorum]
MQRALSAYARRSRISLKAFVELVRGKTASDYRPNKNLVPAVMNELCKDYKHFEHLQKIVREGDELRLKEKLPQQQKRPSNHRSAKDRLNILRKNICKEQDAGLCLVLARNLLAQWSEIFYQPLWSGREKRRRCPCMKSHSPRPHLQSTTVLTRAVSRSRTTFPATQWRPRF